MTLKLETDTEQRWTNTLFSDETIKKYNPFYDSLPLFSIYTLYNSQLMYIGGIDIYIYIFKYEIEKD